MSQTNKGSRKANTRSVWTVTVVGGAIAGVIGGFAIHLLLRDGPAAAKGTILADDQNGRVVLIDPEGLRPPQSLTLAARDVPDDPQTGIKGLSASQPRWSSRDHAFVAISGAAGYPYPYEIAEYALDGRFIGTLYTSDSDEFDHVDPSPTDDQVVVTARRSSTTAEQGPTRLLLVRGGVSREIGQSSGAWGPVSTSPDGQQLAAQCSPGGASPRLCVINLPDGEVTEYTSAPYENLQQPSWSPSGDKIVFVLLGPESPGSQIALLDTATGEIRLLTNDDRDKDSPVLSPDGATFAFTTANGPILRNIASGDERTLTGTWYSSLQWVSETLVADGGRTDEGFQ